ncbi:DNA polymerase III subunit beta [Thiothrix lacustris]|uniref:Beta sliding clamp n=1 Tax=Thiothrix lacustris TaxID=525917 RepID=A0ABY9MK60_9GAMM|nr:DNA polymerase III subunit beta [Thiothrix lacustris]WML89065.1 DNA polymerase III subunit beta [Thiothrix lacustris]WMP15719.1 DNA polymerase III subunit beta [Thiothrix lacustris]
MRLIQTREHLLESLQATLGAIEKRHTAPILENVLLRIQGNQSFWRGTDLELEIATNNPIIDGTDGEITLPARKLADICKSLPAESIVNIEVQNDKRARVTSGRSRFELATLPATEFPELEDIGDVHTLSLPENLLKHLLESVAYAMANQDVRYYLNGLLLEVNSDGIRTVATDGHRLSLCFHTMAMPGVEQSRQLIIPRKGVLELSRLLRNDCQVPLQLQSSQNHLRVQLDNLRFTSKLVDGRYPDYRAAVPGGGQIQVDLDRKTFKDTLSRVAILSNEKFRGVRLSLSENRLKIEANNPEQEVATDELDVHYSGKDFSIGFNVTYLLDAVNHLSGETLRLHCNSPESSVLLTDPDDETVRNVIMPIRL